MIDVASGDQERLALGLGGIFSVVWSPDGAQLAFTGNTARQSDIYLYDLKTAKLTNLTDDLFSDALPSWSPDGSRVYFSSDRGNLLSGEGVTQHTFPYRQTDLYGIDIETRKVERVVDWPNSDETSSVVSPDGKKVLFLSDRNGIENMYEVTLETRRIRPITNSISGVYQLSLSRDGSKLAFSSLHKSGFDIFLMRNPWDRTLKADDLEPTDYFKMLSPQAKPPAAPAVAAVTGTGSGRAGHVAALRAGHPARFQPGRVQRPAAERERPARLGHRGAPEDQGQCRQRTARTRSTGTS